MTVCAWYEIAVRLNVSITWEQCLIYQLKKTHMFMPRQPFGIPPEEGWPHSDHTQPGCGQLDILYYSWKIWQEIDGLVIHLHSRQIKIFICAYAYNL